jgi:hypothetical protein
MKKEEFKKRIENNIAKYGYQVTMTSGNSDFTRHEFVKGKLIKNYIDYIIQYGIDIEEFNIRKPIGTSDHWTLEARMNKNEIDRKIVVNKEIIESFNKAKGEVNIIAKLMKDAIKDDDRKKKVVELLTGFSKKYKMRVRRPMNIYNMTERIRKQLLEGKTEKAFREMKRICRNANKEQYSIFLTHLEEMKIQRRMKEYFMRLRFYTEIDKNTDILKNLVDPTDGRVITNKIEINGKVHKKYTKLFADNGSKDRYFFDRNTGVITLTGEDVIQAVEAMNNDKAMSWDFIHGSAFDILLKDKDKLGIAEDIAKLINEILCDDILPEQILTSRLFCLNKEGSKPGNLDAIRPIAITSTLVKIIEKVILGRIEHHIYSKKIIHRNQIGFMKGAGTDMNLMKIRHMSNKLKEQKAIDQKYIYFLDLKNAYDSVNHRVLFMKMERCGIDRRTINTIKLLYSNARLMIDRLSGGININKGVLQGSLISPLLFNLYINDLVDELSGLAFDVLAYADDIAVLCRNRKELDKVINTVEQWSNRNLIGVNKKKSGIMCIQGKAKEKTIRDYPVVKEYKYLGILINDKLRCDSHITNINDKLKQYIKRNFMLQQTKFSIRTLFMIFNYFQKSRMLYGMSSFCDLNTELNRIQTVFMTNFKAIMKLPISTSNVRLRVALGLSDMNTYLKCKLLKDYFKFKKIFGFFPEHYKDTLIKKFGKVKVARNEVEAYIEIVKKESIRAEALEKGIELSDDYEDRIYEGIYKYAWNKEFYLMYFFSGVGFFNKRYKQNCQHCGMENSRRHAVDECRHYLEWREKARDILECSGSIEDRLMQVYYQGDGSMTEWKKLVRKMNMLIQELYFTQKSDEQKLRKRDYYENESNFVF